MTEPKKQIIIGGCPRSGTSLFADFLVQCGFRTVSDSRASDQYPRGYHEYFPLLLFHAAMERYPRGAMHRITSEPFLTTGLLTDEYSNLLYQQAFIPFQDEKYDFIKYPQLALSIDFLLETYPNIHFIALWRKPAAVFKSLVQKEFPVEMRPASGIKAILLQAVYASHILEAVQHHPERITVYSIDELIDDEIDLAPVLKGLGYEVSGIQSITRRMDQKIWTRRVPFFWYLYYLSMRLFLLILSPFLPIQKRKFSRLGSFDKKILKVCDGSNHIDF